MSTVQTRHDPTLTHRLRSRVTHAAWPAMPSERGATLLALLGQLDETQWWSGERLLDQQLRQIDRLLRHACATTPFYRDRFGAAPPWGDAAPTLDAFRTLPMLTRRDVQSAGDALHSRALDPRFGGTAVMHTSGSTGEPVKLLASDLDRVLWEALTLRDHDWHRRDLGARLASIRANIGAAAQAGELQDWGMPTSELYATGPSFTLSSNADYARQTAWLARQRPDYLVTYPSNLDGLIEHCRRHGVTLPGLREVRTTGETLSDELRERCRETFGAEVVDVYSSQECGYLALECPQSGLYHVMSETVLLEILGPDDRTCREGETGELVVTVLHNFASPLIRYRLGDHAERGPSCPCGRGLPTLRRIRGRSRNLVRLPDGTRHWPMVGFYEYREVAPVRQYQALQYGPEDIELRLVTDRPLSAAEESRLRAIVQRWLQYPFGVRFVYYPDRIPPAPSGKYEDFICLV